MRILLIGGTGTISGAVTRQLAAEGHDVWVLNRGHRREELPVGVRLVVADIHDEAAVDGLLGDVVFDAVCEFVGFRAEQVERDFRLFRQRTRQYVFVSSASACHKPVRHYLVSEGTTLANPYWQYSRDKIACEERLMHYYRAEGFPVTIVRPSHTYGERKVPVGLHGAKGSWQVLRRMLEGRPVLVHGDGSSLWTMTWNEDFARGFVGLLGNPHAIGEAFQIMSDESLTWNQIYETIAGCLGVTCKPYHVASDFLAAVAPKDYDVEGNLLGDKACSVVFDCTKLKRMVPGWQAETRFEEGVGRSIAYVLRHQECQVADPVFDEWCDRVIAAQESAYRCFAK